MKTNAPFLKKSIMTLMLTSLLFLPTACGNGTEKSKAQGPDALKSTPQNTEQTTTPSKSVKIPIATGELAPYCSERIDGKGLLPEIITAAFKEAGMEADLQFYPWARSEEMVYAGDVWAVFPYYLTPEASKHCTYSDELIISNVEYFYFDGGKIKGNIDFKDPAELKKYTFGSIPGYAYVPRLKEYHMTTEYAQNVDELTQMLGNKRVDLMLEDTMIARYTIKKYFPEEAKKFKTFNKKWSQDSFYLAASNKYPDSKKILEKFNAGLKAIKANGVYDQIVRKYEAE